MTKTDINSLGFAKSPADTRVVVAMSGGVDSSVCAAMLAREGYDVIGLTMQLYDHGAALKKKGACCAGQDIYDARRVSEMFGFPHYVLDYESKFSDSVMDDFADTYLKGSTPIPCVRCNQTVKFKDLLTTAKELGADCMATGHYIRRIDGENGPELHRAFDGGKDQSYFLFATTKDQLDYLRFPLGAQDKDETRRLAVELGLDVASKPDSQDICFVPDGNYADVIRKLRPEAETPGNMVHMDGRILGEHNGIINFTVGQRRGLGIAVGEPLFVTGINAVKNEVVVGPREALLVSRVFLKEINWLGDGTPDPSLLAGQPVNVKLRSMRRPSAAHFGRDEKGRLCIDLETGEEGVAPGQACVFYDPAGEGSRVLGGGWITGTDSVYNRAAA